MSAARRFLVAVAVLTAMRAVAAAVLPLSADEAYYWLWSRHLAAGYFDHPPAIAFVIRFGTSLFGDTAFGVRFGALVLSLAASGFVWGAGAALTGDRDIGARACLFFNLTLMIFVETLAATPDAPAVACAAAALYALARLVQSDRGAWWLGVGAAAGLGLLSKYTALFLGGGIAVWLLLAPDGRRWLVTAWPWAGGVVALAIFMPNLLWNAGHDWMTFAFQFGRIAGGHLTLRFLFEFLGAQLVLASPFLFALAALGLAFRGRERDGGAFLLAALVFPSALYFLIHSLHDRIQGNWPSFLYPALAIAAAQAFAQRDWPGWRAAIWRVARPAAVPVAALLLLAVYAQAVFGVVPFGRGDPLARLLAVGIDDVAAAIDAAERRTGAAALVTTDYESTAWYAFYLRPRLPLIQATDAFRYPDAAVPDAALLSKPLLYVAEKKLDRHGELTASFARVEPIAAFDRKRRGVAIAHYTIYRLTGWRGTPLGRVL
ncbi:MAG TPA: glycosyltransferase family 39 protein [Rhizomicrobium sp.]